MTFKTQITTAIATGAVLLSALAPAALAETATITGNGAFSDNTINTTTDNTTNVTQTNAANITNNITSKATTGGNSSSFNTGGNTTIVTGDAATKVDVSNLVNLNKANVSGCGACGNQNLNLKISGNGAGAPREASVDSVQLPIGASDNAINVKTNNTVDLTQVNDAHIDNNVNAKSDTGKNDSSFNTGGDSITVTGDAATLVNVENKANANIANIGGGTGRTEGSSAQITGNGAFSDNGININQNSAVALTQVNTADIANDIKAKSNTGKNNAEFNTGGETTVVTGDAGTQTNVDNLVNFNKANISCDCVLGDLNVKVADNGAESDNDAVIKAKNSVIDTQDNIAGLLNDVNGKSKTGNNDVSFGTGDTNGDPLIKTGDSFDSTGVSNAGNVNLFNNGESLRIGNLDFSAHFDLGDLLSFIHLG